MHNRHAKVLHSFCTSTDSDFTFSSFFTRPFSGSCTVSNCQLLVLFHSPLFRQMTWFSVDRAHIIGPPASLWAPPCLYKCRLQCHSPGASCEIAYVACFGAGLVRHANGTPMAPQWHPNGTPNGTPMAPEKYRYFLQSD